MFSENYVWICVHANNSGWRMTSSFVMSSISVSFSQLKVVSGAGLMDFKILFLKTLNFPAFSILWSRLFHFGKMSFLKNFILFWKRVYFQHFWWCKKIALRELVPKDTEEIHFCKISKSSIIFCTGEGVKGTLQSFSWYFETFWCFTKFSFHQKWNNAPLLLINMVYMSCWTT